MNDHSLLIKNEAAISLSNDIATLPLLSKNKGNKQTTTSFIRTHPIKKVLLTIGRKAISFGVVDLIFVCDFYVNTKFVSSFGNNALAATFLVDTTLNWSLGIYTALEQPVAILSSNYAGRIKELLSKDKDDMEVSRLEAHIGEVVQLGWLMGIACCVPLSILLWNIEPILLRLGQDAVATDLARQFMRYYVFSLPFRFLNGVSTNLVTATDREWFLIPYNLITLAVGIPVGYLLTFGKVGLAPMVVTGYGASRVAVQVAGFIAINTFFLKNRSIQRYKLYHPRRAALHYFKEMMKLGTPLIIYSLAVNTTNFALSMMIGRLGNLQTSVVQTVDQYLSWFQVIATAVANGTCVSIAQLFGAGLFGDVKTYSLVGTLLGSSAYIIPLIAFAAFPMQLAKFFMGDGVNNAETLIRVNFIFAVLNSISSYLRLTTTYNLSSLRENLVPMLMTVLINLAITIPLSYALSEKADYGLTGINIGMFTGATFTAATLILKWLRDTNKTNLPVRYQKLEASEQSRDAAQQSTSYSSYIHSGLGFFRQIKERAQQQVHGLTARLGF